MKNTSSEKKNQKKVMKLEAPSKKNDFILKTLKILNKKC